MNLKSLSHRPSTPTLWCLVIVGGVVGNYLISHLGDAFVATGHPESLVAAQTTFSAQELMHHFAVLRDNGTLETYRRLQMFDYALMFFNGMFYFSLPLLLARAQRSRRLHRFGVALALVLPSAFVFDAFENATLFWILMDPTRVSDGAAFLYSGLATVKWIIAACAATMVPLLVGAVHWLATRGPAASVTEAT